MISNDKNMLLFMEPKGPMEPPVNDYLTQKLERLLKIATEGSHYMGVHTCTCGCNAKSKSCNLYINKKMATNSLALHYLRDHRSKVPLSEIKKLEAL